MKIALLGYGKMGKTIETLATDQHEEIVLRVDSRNTHLIGPDDLKQADVAIEFSRPDQAVGNILRCFEAGVPVVVGTTGWLEQWDLVTRTCELKQGGLFWASNFSIGVQLFMAVHRQLAELMSHHPEYRDISISEEHHVHKKDAPSGTAITLAEQLIDANPRFREWMSIPRESTPPDEIASDKLPVYSSRIDEVPGTHTVHYRSSIDELEITHRAFNREGFAQGAIVAARFMTGKQGIYSMKDLLHL